MEGTRTMLGSTQASFMTFNLTFISFLRSLSTDQKAEISLGIDRLAESLFQSCL
jgi:hypothetical protein